MIQHKDDMTMEELSEQFAPPAIDIVWGEPEPLEGKLKPVKSFDIHWLPVSLQIYSLDVANRLQIPVDFVAVGLMISLASLVGARCAMRPKTQDSWMVIPNLWGGIVGSPSLLKSPALTEATSFLRKLQNDRFEEFQKANAEYERELKYHAMESKAIEKCIADGFKQKANSEKSTQIEQHQTRLEGLAQPVKPVLCRYTTNDSTVEKIAELLTENPRGILMHTDELIALLSSFDKLGREGDRAFYLQAWNGDASYTVDRISRGTIKVESLCISLVGTIQPAKLNEYILQAYSMTANDGLIQRLQLLVYPDKVENWQYVDCKPDYEAKQAIQAIFEKLEEKGFITQAAKADPFSRFPYYSFDDEAQQIFKEWQISLRRKVEYIEQQGESLPLGEHLSKFSSLMPSLALLFHLVEIAASDQPYHFVSAENAKRAVAWCDYLETHAERIYDISSIRKQGAIKLAAMLKKQKLADGFNCRDIYRKGWFLLKTPQEAESAIDELIEKSWLQEDPMTSEQVRGGSRYLINPKIFDQ